LTVTAEDKSKVFGSSDPEFTVSYAGFEGEDDEDTLGGTLSFTRETGEDVGTYAITPAGYTSDNYTINFVNGTLAITKKVLTVTAEDKSKVFGSSDPEFTVTYAGFESGEDKDALGGSLSFTREVGEDVGSYVITPSGLASSNYTIAYVTGEMLISPKSLYIVVNEDQSKFSGQSDPVFTYQVQGFVFGDDTGILSGNLMRDLGEKLGVYNINIGSLAASTNYIIEFKGAVFTILASQILQIMDLQDVSVPWNTAAAALAFPSEILVMTVDGRFIYVPVKWDLSNVNLLGRGIYPIAGTLVLPEDMQNPSSMSTNFTLTVLPKPAPEDAILTNKIFDVLSGSQTTYIGDVKVIDPVDDIHEIVLINGMGDNKYFQIIGNSLYWNSSERLPGRMTFQVHVLVTDRDGNTIIRIFEVIRQRQDVEDFKIINTFTPDGDGINDTWGVEELRFYSGVRVSVYERSGQRMFYTENPEVHWDGTYMNRELAQGTYYYVIEIKELNIVKRGFITIMRK